MPWWTWLITAGSLLGAVLNARKSIKGFYIWVGANVAWVIYDFSIGEMSQAVLFLAYTGITIYGIMQWRKSDKNCSS